MSLLIRNEARLFLREPAAVFWGLAFPIVLLVVVGSIPSSREAVHDLGGLRFIDVYTPILICLTLGILAINALPPVLAGYREKGVLRRLATTPTPPVRVLGAQLAVHLAVATITWISIIAVARIAFGVELPQQPIGFVLVVALVAVTLLSMGLLIASLASTARVANAAGAVVFFPMMFFAGLWLPRVEMPDVLRHISDFTPLGAATAAIEATMQGEWPHLLHVGVLAAYCAVYAVAAIKLFRWQ